MFTKKSLLLILSIICISVFSYFIYNNVKYDYVASENDFNDKNAQNELYEYLIKENPEITKLYPEQCPKENVNAFYYDLDDDKIPEIIGFPNWVMYQGTSGVTLYVLKKTNDNYENISYLVNFYFQKGIKILKHKTNSYKDLKITVGYIAENSNEPYIDKIKSINLIFNGKYYVDTKLLEQLERIMQHNK